MRWLIQRGVLPIPRAKNASQATQNAEALIFALDDAEAEALSQAIEAARP
jgi:diketogulonate reductase-like aldo/keto reductase